MAKLLSGILFTSPLIAPSAMAYPAPYCSAASAAGGQWWNWTALSTEQACTVARQQLFRNGFTVDFIQAGYYETEGINQATLVCVNGTTQVVGLGANVFVQAMSVMNQTGLNGCIIQMAL